MKSFKKKKMGRNGKRQHRLASASFLDQDYRWSGLGDIAEVTQKKSGSNPFLTFVVDFIKNLESQKRYLPPTQFSLGTNNLKLPRALTVGH